MTKAKPISPAGRERVERVLAMHGLLLQQGQAEIPSVADLLEGSPVTTRGYSWDYVPAWSHCDALCERADVARAKLFRGRTTLIQARHWSAVSTLAYAAAARVRARSEGDPLRNFLALVESTPGIAGSDIRLQLGVDAKHFQRVKSILEKRLCIFGIERDDLGYHTHELRWYPWVSSKIAHGAANPVSSHEMNRADVEEATAMLLSGVYPGARPIRLPRTATLFPLLAG
jgi:hypothetical protein